jgi:hypothetical protein
MRGCGLIYLAQDGDNWRPVVKKVRNIHVGSNAENALIGRGTVGFKVRLSVNRKNVEKCDCYLSYGNKGTAILYRPGLVLLPQEVETTRMSRQSAHEGSKLFSPTHISFWKG